MLSNWNTELYNKWPLEQVNLYTTNQIKIQEEYILYNITKDVNYEQVKRIYYQKLLIREVIANRYKLIALILRKRNNIHKATFVKGILNPDDSIIPIESDEGESEIKEFFEKLLYVENEDVKLKGVEYDNRIFNTNLFSTGISIDESALDNLLNQLKKNKAVGIDDILDNLYKFLLSKNSDFKDTVKDIRERIIDFMFDLLHEKRTIPDYLKVGKMLLLSKNGTQLVNLNNYSLVLKMIKESLLTILAPEVIQ